jgi:hypothetical protein
MANKSENPTTAAFDWLDSFFATPQDSPDEAFDWIYAMEPDDWECLEKAWPDRPSEWRESCAFVLGEGPVPESLPVLRIALFDEELSVSTQAAASYAGQRLNYDEEVPLDADVIDRLRELVETGEPGLDIVVEVLETLVCEGDDEDEKVADEEDDDDEEPEE